jgi:hypothetical protein
MPGGMLRLRIESVYGKMNQLLPNALDLSIYRGWGRGFYRVIAG